MVTKILYIGQHIPEILALITHAQKPHLKALARGLKVSEYDQEIPHSHTADQPMAP